MQKHFQYSSKEVLFLLLFVCSQLVCIPACTWAVGVCGQGCVRYTPPTPLECILVLFTFTLYSSQCPSFPYRRMNIPSRSAFGKAYHIRGPYHPDWWLSRATFWFKVDFLPKILGIITHVIHKKNFKNGKNWKYGTGVLQTFWCSVESETKMIIWVKPSLCEIITQGEIEPKVIVHSLIFCCILRFYFLQIRLVHNIRSGKPRGFAFVEYEHERDMHCKYTSPNRTHNKYNSSKPILN